MIRALLYLQYHTVRNRLHARLRRLKRPKYMFGAIFGALYFLFYFSFLIRKVAGAGGDGNAPGLPGGMGVIGAENLGAFLLFLLVVLIGWILPNQRAALAFSEAEIAFLFPAPITRRGLIQYKLIRSQLGILFSIFFLTLIWGRWRQGGHVWISLLGWWVILSTLNLNLLAGSFVRTMLLDKGLTNWARRILILLAVIAVGAYAIHGWPSLPYWNDDHSQMVPPELVNWLKAGLSTGLTPYILYPFRLVVRPYLAAEGWSFLKALGPALVVMGLHYLFVIHADVAFEEASIEYSRKLVTRVETMRQRQGGGLMAPSKPRKDPFTLRPTGAPYMAFLWKNLILAGNFFSLRTWWILGWLVFVGGAIANSAPHHSMGPSIVGILCLVFLGFSVLLGPLILRADFRADLPNAESLMLYPLPGWQIVLGEILALIPNAVALVLPSWVRFDKNAPRGIENVGQNLIQAIGVMVTMMVVMLPAGLAMVGFYALGSWLLGPMPAMLIAAVAGAAVILGEAAVAIYFLGFAFENFDVSAEMTN